MIERSRGGAFVARLSRVVAVAALFAAAAVDASAQFCSNCILNSASPQVAQFNVSSATIRGRLTVGELVISTISASTVTATTAFIGPGSLITALNASALASGTVPTARISGAYTGITQVGTLAAGVWNGTVIAPAYGGTGANLSAAAAGGLPYFTGSGVQGVIASPAGQRVLVTAGSGATPAWTTSPTIVGTNFSAIPLTALSNGTLQAGIQVPNASLVSIDAAKVSGNISGGAAFLTVALPISDLAAGTLPTTNAASSVTASGVAPGYYGGPTTLAQIHVNYDGRIDVARQYNIVFYSTGMAPGTLPPGVLLPAAQVSSGTLAANVVASSVAASGVVPGSYGDVTKALTAVVGIDGRLTSLTQASIALPLSQLNSGNLPSGVHLPAASVNAGTLGPSVIASSLAVNGVPAGTYGSSVLSPQITVGLDGRITNITQFAIPGVSTSAAWVDRNNNWTYPQTSVSSWTATAFKATGIGFSGLGSNITQLTPANILAGYLGASVIASSVNVRAVGDLQLTVTGVSAGSKGSSTRVPVLTVDAQGRLTALTDAAIAISTGEVSGIVQAAKGGTGNDWSATASGGVPYFSATGVLSVLAKSVNGYSLVQAAGVPAWASAVSSATNVAGGATNSLVIQTAANTSGFVATGTGALYASGGTPSYTLTPTLTGTNFSGIPLSALVTGGLPVAITVSTANVVPGFNGASNLVQMTAGGIYPAASGANITALTAANISSGYLGSSVIASSVNVSGVTAGTYGSSGASHPNITVGVDGRITSAASVSIAIAASQVTSGQLAIAQGGTNLSSAGGTSNRVLRTSDGTTFVMGQVIGPDIAVGTIPVSALNQSGAASTNVLAWNGSNWAPSAAAAGTVTTTAGAAAGGTARFTGSTSISTGAFTDNGTTVTVPSGKAFVVSSGATFQFPQLSTTVYMNTASYTAGGGSGANQFVALSGSTACWTADGVSTYTVVSTLYGKSDSTLAIYTWYLLDGAFLTGYSASIANAENDGGQPAANTNFGVITNAQVSPAAGTRCISLVANSHGAGGGANLSVNAANGDGGTQPTYRSFVRVQWP